MFLKNFCFTITLIFCDENCGIISLIKINQSQMWKSINQLTLKSHDHFPNTSLAIILFRSFWFFLFLFLLLFRFFFFFLFLYKMNFRNFGYIFCSRFNCWWTWNRQQNFSNNIQCLVQKWTNLIFYLLFKWSGFQGKYQSMRKLLIIQWEIYGGNPQHENRWNHMELKTVYLPNKTERLTICCRSTVEDNQGRYVFSVYR